jgi:hypothetical protein
MTLTAPEFTGLASLEAVPDVHIPLVLTAAEPVLHGAGNSGNTQLLRTQDVLLPDGRRTSVPYVSGNSLRHTLRAALAWHLVRLLDVPYGSLPKAVADLLWSGGSLSSAGSSADLATARRVHATLPALGLLGYSARNDITAGTLAADNIHLVCAENAWRLPAPLASHPHASLPAGAARSEEFGTRHDIAGTPVDRYIALLDGEAAPATTQMIYDAQVIKPGAVLFTGLHLHAPSPGHVAALATALDEAAPAVDGQRRIVLGGKRSAGYGTCITDAGNAFGGDGLVAELRASYEEHLRASRDAVLALLAEVTG